MTSSDAPTGMTAGLYGNSWGTITGTSNMPDILFDIDTIILNWKDILTGNKSIHLERDNHGLLNRRENRSSYKLNVTIVMKYPRSDRLGSNVQRPLHLMAYANCKGYNFCAIQGRLGPGEIFGFPICPSEWSEQQQQEQKFPFPWIGTIFEMPVNRSGMYTFQRDDTALLRAISENINCAYSSSFRQKWKEMIFRVPYYKDGNSVASQELFSRDGQGSPIVIAVHVRRGDIMSRHPIYIPDGTIIATIRKLKQLLWMTLGKDSQVHLFSEDYGDTNWTAYTKEGGLVDYFHLAPQMNQKRKHAMDMHLNLRDWKHFITADVLVVGGTFSRIASYAREDPDAVIGLPLTVTFCHTPPCQPSSQFDWSGVYVKFRKDAPDAVEFLHFPVPFSHHVKEKG
jgi:hypothetical protein